MRNTHTRNKPLGEGLKGSFIVSAVWLFANMLLALAMLFLAANAVAIHPPPTASSTHIVATPSPTPLPRLELVYHEFTMNINSDGLLNDSQSASNAVVQQVKAQAFLKGRSAGLVIVYGGAPGDAQIASAQTVARKVYSILASLGKQGYVFNRASYYSPLFLLGASRNIAVVDVYLFAE